MKKFRIEVKWGILFFISGLAWMALEKYLGWHDRLIEQHATYTLLYAPLAIFYLCSCTLGEKEKNLQWEDDIFTRAAIWNGDYSSGGAAYSLEPIHFP